MINTIYSKEFFKENERTYLSAQKVVPLIIDLLKPTNLVDVGCGIGSWIKAFQENGVKDFIGIDGDYLNKDELLFDKSKFISQDLSKSFNLQNKRFDIALSLEVAEHIAKKYARVFIQNLVNLSDIIIFSAAVPKQKGTHHVNEQWPNFWKGIFSEFGYELLDPFRWQILNLPEVDICYKQNMLLAVNKSVLNNGKFVNLPKYNEDFLILHKIIFRRNVLFLRIKNFIKNHILKRGEYKF